MEQEIVINSKIIFLLKQHNRFYFYIVRFIKLCNKHKTNCIMLNNVLNVQVSDTTKVEPRTNARLKKIIQQINLQQWQTMCMMQS